ncbi:rod-binding protein [Brucella sp. IR073]|uniref:rod-binding protein n=1 Tax=unclassified Brucella TaxID=2632610 RepID=UPI003B987706
MAISPPSDLVLDVANAADPETYRASVERLRSIAASRMTADPSALAFSVEAVPADALRPKSANPASAYTKFEAFMLQTFVQSMLPQDANAVFGKGIAGEYWKSMMAEAIAEKMADAGGIGIARMLEAQGRRAADGTTQAAILHQAERALIKQQLDTDADTESTPRTAQGNV